MHLSKANIKSFCIPWEFNHDFATISVQFEIREYFELITISVYNNFYYIKQVFIDLLIKPQCSYTT